MRLPSYVTGVRRDEKFLDDVYAYYSTGRMPTSEFNRYRRGWIWS